MKPGILVDLERCVGCWTCSMICKASNLLEENEWRNYIRSLGDGSGVDEPEGVYPNLKLRWMPIFTNGCTLCAPRIAEGELPYCVYNCPTQAMAFGDREDPESDFNKTKAELEAKGRRVFELDEWENQRPGVFYSEK